MGQEDINPEFRTSTEQGKKGLTKEEVIEKLQSNTFWYYEFRNKGIINSRKYSFITKRTFSKYEKNSVDGGKNEEEITKAEENLKVVEDYLNRYKDEYSDSYKVKFKAVGDIKCVLYNPNRFDKDSLEEKMREIFY